MPKLRLTRKAIDALPNPKSGQVFHRDSELRGFGVCVGGREKSFFVERQTNGRTRRVTLGRVTDLSVEAARARAMETLAAFGRGGRPAPPCRPSGRRSRASSRESPTSPGDRRQLRPHAGPLPEGLGEQARQRDHQGHADGAPPQDLRGVRPADRQ